jgi:hypothetical protein
MRTLLLLPLLLMPVALQNGTGDGAPVTVVGAQWTKTRQKVEYPDTQGPAPAQSMNPANKINERNRRLNAPAGMRDPNEDTIDGRSAALERAVRESRSPRSDIVEGYAYRAKVRNQSAKAVDVIYWEYQFQETANPSNLTRRQFLCGVQLKGGREKELQAFGGSGPAGTISAESLAANTVNPFAERVVVNRIEFADGAIWQRKDWNYAEVRASIQRAISTPWGAEMCRAL